jgi:hypothetical protein
MNSAWTAYEKAEAVLMTPGGGVLATRELALPGAFVASGTCGPGDALRRRLEKSGVDVVSLVPMARVDRVHVFIGRADAPGAFSTVSVPTLDAALKASAPSAPAIARLAALTVAKHARQLTEKLAEA